MVYREAGEYHKFDGVQYQRVASRSSKARALAAKERITEDGKILVRILKVQPNVVGLPHHYAIYARPADGMKWVRLHQAVLRRLR